MLRQGLQLSQRTLHVSMIALIKLNKLDTAIRLLDIMRWKGVVIPYVTTYRIVCLELISQQQLQLGNHHLSLELVEKMYTVAVQTIGGRAVTGIEIETETRQPERIRENDVTSQHTTHIAYNNNHSKNSSSNNVSRNHSVTSSTDSDTDTDATINTININLNNTVNKNDRYNNNRYRKPPASASSSLSSSLFRLRTMWLIESNEYMLLRKHLEDCEIYLGLGTDRNNNNNNSTSNNSNTHVMSSVLSETESSQQSTSTIGNNRMIISPLQLNQPWPKERETLFRHYNGAVCSLAANPEVSTVGR